MATPRSAAIYARISEDHTGEGLGVERQLEDCRRLAVTRGWTVSGEYVDNDVSAYQNRPRPQYQRLLADIRDNRVEAVIVYHLDRLTRKPIEFEQFALLCQEVGVESLITVIGDVGLGNDNGMLIARITGAVAANESARKAARIRRAGLQRAERGMPAGGSRRPFGFETDRVTIRESEAVIIRSLAARYLAGASLRSLAVSLNTDGIPTTGPAAGWSSRVVRGILLSGRIAGLRDYHRQLIGPAVWEAIITPAAHDAIVTAIAARKPKQRSGARPVYLLSGMLRCGSCGSTLIVVNSAAHRCYQCLVRPEKPTSCGKVTITAHLVETWITAEAMKRLDTTALADIMSARAANNEMHASLTANLTGTETRLAELVDMLGTGAMTRGEFLIARRIAEARRVDARRAIDRSADTPDLEGLVGNGQTLSRTWASLTIDRQRAIIRGVLVSATVHATVHGGRGAPFDPSRVSPTWVSERSPASAAIVRGDFTASSN